MDTVTPFTRQSSIEAGTSAPTSQAGRTLSVTATYKLSEEGRKASLLAGGDGRAVQEIAVHVPANRLHLVSVDVNGVARLKLQPRYQLDQNQRVVRIDAVPVYDAPPELEDLFREAARNHQLEGTYQAERRTRRATRREAGRERRQQLAQRFLDDKTQRALVHPAPTPKRCYLETQNGRVLFDANTDDAPAREVPPEAHRRFQADLRGRREENLQRRAEQFALHEEKKRFIDDWIRVHGTPEQQARQAAGVLSMDEAIEAITEHAFAVLANRTRYERDGLERLQQHLRQYGEHANATVARNELLVTSANANTMTASQFAAIRDIQRLLPDATVTFRTHRLAWKRDRRLALSVAGILVTQTVGPFTVRREYAAWSATE